MTEETYQRDLQFIHRLKPEQLHALILRAKREAARQKQEQEGQPSAIPQAVTDFLRQLEHEDQTPGRSPEEADYRRADYYRKLCRLAVPAPRQQALPERELYRRLKERAQELHLPASFAADLLPELVAYQSGAVVRPIVLTGPPGCGKTTAGRCLAQMAGLPFALISAPRADGGSGLQGISKIYRSADAGEFVHAIVKNQSLRELFFIDELDKAAALTSNRSALQDELLNILQDRVVHDNFLEEMPIDISDSLIVLAVNDLNALSKPFLDRCRIIEFAPCEPDRMRSILRDYKEKYLQENHFAGKVRLDDDLLDRASDRLYRKNITSIRQHEQLVEQAIRRAYRAYLESDAEAVPVTETDFRDFIDSLTGKQEARSVGFRM